MTTTPVEPVAWYLDGLRRRAYDGGGLERLHPYDEADGYAISTIAYRSEGLRVTGLLAAPDGPGPFPAVVVNHGFYRFDRYEPGLGTLEMLRALASRGYLAVAPDYRNHAGSERGEFLWVPGYVYDVRNLVRALRELPEARRGATGMIGHSMGAGITLQAVASGAEVGAVALFGTVSGDEADRWDARMHRWAREGQPDRDAVAFAERYGTPAERPEVYAQMSPSHDWSRVTAPVMLHHGTADLVTPLCWATAVHDGLTAAGKAVTLHIYPGAGHFLSGDDFTLAMSRTLDLFDAALKS